MRRFPRSAGILCHVTSLPGGGEIGDLGEGAVTFIDWLASARQGIWQVLPLGPPGYGESPYQSFSAFAGNGLLIGLDQLAEAGWLPEPEIQQERESPAAVDLGTGQRVDFERVRAFRERCLTLAHARFLEKATSAERAALEAFRRTEAWWLEDYALFAALKLAHGMRPWTEWEPDLVKRQPAALQKWSARLADAFEREIFVQFQFHQQWRELKSYANARGIRLMGDVPIFVAHDSADVWASPELFHLDARGLPAKVAGVPPDYFSATGQLWGNPLYRWEQATQSVFKWWVRRFRHALRQFDLVRLDHFRGFESYWEVPAGDRTAAGGRWVAGPRADFFRHVIGELGELPLVAEDLGVITPEVDALREEFGFPGMRILQFAFGDDPKASDYQPHNYVRNCVVYTGTHDNDTTLGWFASQAGDDTTRTAEQIKRERAFTLEYLGTDGSEIHWDLIRLAQSSIADTAIVPLQDVLGLGSGARMNLPGTASGNWRWRCPSEALTPELAGRLARMAVAYDREDSSEAKRVEKVEGVKEVKGEHIH